MNDASRYAFRIEVSDEPINVRRGEKDGRPWEVREQTAYFYTGGRYPEKFTLRLDKNQPPYTPGEYFVDPASVRISQYGEPQFGRALALVPVASVKPVKAA